MTLLPSIGKLFIGESPQWYKNTVCVMLILNPFLYYFFNPVIAGWAILVEFIFILAFALTCYPLFSGGLLALEAMVLKMAPLEDIMKELHGNLDVIMLLMFMVPAIFFLKPLLVRLFIRILSVTRHKTVLSMSVLLAAAFLSAWLDALTVIAVMTTVCTALQEIYAKIRPDITEEESEEFKGFLRNLLMHAAIGTALGGVATLVGEPQNLLIGHHAGWQFRDFYLNMAHFSIPLQLSGVLTCFVLEHFRVKALGFGYQISPEAARAIAEYSHRSAREKGKRHHAEMAVMSILMMGLMLALAFQIAPIGLVGLGLLILAPLLTGYVNEHDIGKAFEESMPFTSLLVVFFIIVTMIDHLGLFQPVTGQVLQFSGKMQLYAMFLATGVLSSISDNVFVASIYIHQIHDALNNGIIDRFQFERLAVMVNAGTNICSVATPNGQAAFLFLLTSALARKVKLSYKNMLILSLPYTVVFVAVSLILISF